MLRFILEGYDNLTVLRTRDPQMGIIELSIPPGCENEVEMVVESLGNEMRILPINTA